jgi:hypothetical protein
MIKSGVILFILGSLTATFTVIVELVRKYKRRQYHYS